MPENIAERKDTPCLPKAGTSTEIALRLRAF